MQNELRGCVPKLPFAFTKTLVNRAWKVIRESNLWSFNLFESTWISPPVETAGTCAVTQGATGITFDATARAALAADQSVQPYSLITQRQFRTGAGGIYSIVALNLATGVATLDRPFGDIGNAAAAYQVYQLYYPAPFADHRAWISVRNPQMFLDLILTTTRAQIDAMDPQRSHYQFPSHVVPFMRDNRVNSVTAGYPLFELWGQPLQLFTYQCYGVRAGADLLLPTDTLPQPLGEDLLLPLARSYAYEWAEANKGQSPRDMGPDFKFLIKSAEDDYKKMLQMYRRQDKEFVLNWFISRSLATSGRGSYYNTLSGTAGTSAQ